MPYHVVEFGDYFLYYLFLILYVQELVSAKATTKVSNDDEIISKIGIPLIHLILFIQIYFDNSKASVSFKFWFIVLYFCNYVDHDKNVLKAVIRACLLC